MNQHSIVWDILFVPSAITNSKSSSEILGSIEENLTGLKPTKVMNWNSVLKGQKVSRSGFTSGLRIIYDISYKSKDEILKLTKQLNDFPNPIIANNNLSIASIILEAASASGISSSTSARRPKTFTERNLP